MTFFRVLFAPVHRSSIFVCPFYLTIVEEAVEEDGLGATAKKLADLFAAGCSVRKFNYVSPSTMTL